MKRRRFCTWRRHDFYEEFSFTPTVGAQTETFIGPDAVRTGYLVRRVCTRCGYEPVMPPLTPPSEPNWLDWPNGWVQTGAPTRSV